MYTNVYKGKRITITMSQEIYEAIETLANKETRSNAQMGMLLIKEGLENRGVKIND